jgi:fatty acid desaturase
VDETFAPADLLTRDQVRALMRRSDAKGLAMLASKLAGLAATGALVWLARGTWWLVPAMLLHGIQVAFLFAGLHECVHLSPFRSRRLNVAVGWALGLVTFYPLGYFRHFHFTHHRHTQDPARDPEITPENPATTRLGFAWWASGLPYWRRRVLGSLTHALTGRVAQPFIDARHHAEIVREARIVWAAYLAIGVAAALVDPWAPIVYWLAPIVMAQPLLRLYLNGEHGGAENVRDTFANSRTTRTNALVRWLAWNMPYHTEHHLYPSVPFHALPRLHALVRDRLRDVRPGYVALNSALWRALPSR